MPRQFHAIAFMAPKILKDDALLTPARERGLKPDKKIAQKQIQQNRFWET